MQTRERINREKTQIYMHENTYKLDTVGELVTIIKQ